MKSIVKKLLALALGTMLIISVSTSSFALCESNEVSDSPVYPEYVFDDIQSSNETTATSDVLNIDSSSSDNTISPRIIVGADARSQVKNVNADPFRHYVYIVTTFEDGTVGYSTGFLIGNKTVLTAAHCIYDFESGSGKGIDIKVFPGGWYSNYGYKTVRKVKFNEYWFYSQGEDFSEDYAVLGLSDSFDIGYMYLASVTDDELKSMKNRSDYLYTFGYPSDKPKGTLWCSNGTIRSYTLDFIYNYVDIMPGNSGGPIVTLDDRDTAIGICVAENETSSCNTFLRFNERNLKQIKTWRNIMESY